MTTAIKRRRGTTTQHSTFTGLEGEITVDTTKDTLVVHDGSTAGGFPLLREDLSNNTNVASTSTTQTFTNKTINLSSNTLTGTTAQFNTALSDGDFATLAGTETMSNKTFSTNPTISSGTANGVAYLNGSKVLTTGSALTFDGSNLGLGVTPSAWGLLKAVDIAGNSAVAGHNNTAYMTSNAFYNGSAWVYKASSYATLYEAGTGSHAWKIAPSGTAGNAISFTQAMTLDASGNLVVGGTTALNTNTGRGNITLNGASTAIISLGVGGVEKGYFYTQGADIICNADTGSFTVQTAAAAPLVFSTNNTERMRINSSGNVGIGTSSPSARLNVVSAAAATSALKITDATNYSLISGYAASSVGYFGGDIGTSLALYSNGAERMRIDSSGNLVVGTTSAFLSSSGRGNISINGSSSAILAVGVGGAAKGWFYADNTNTYITAASDGTRPLVFEVGGSERMRIDSSGNLLLNQTSAPAATLMGGTTKNSTTNVSFQWGPSTNILSTGVYYVLNAAGTGVYLASGNTSWTANSDERIKTTLTPFENAAAKVSTLRAGTGRYLTDDESVSRSFLIAQDVQAVLPEAVTVQGDELGTLGLQYTDVIPLLVAAIQELKAELDATKAEVAALKGV